MIIKKILKYLSFTFYYIFSFDPFSLVEGGYAAIIFMRTKLIHNKEFRNRNSIDEIYVIYFNDILPHQQFLLHSSNSEKSELLSLGFLRGGNVK